MQTWDKKTNIELKKITKKNEHKKQENPTILYGLKRKNSINSQEQPHLNKI
jgi:hypothetical protein